MPVALIVDDKYENRYLLQCLFAGNGYEVVTASNGKEALDCARQILTDVVIADILMPVMDGFSLCRYWKQDARLRSVPFVFYTATYTDPKDEEFALSLGADLFIVKPKDPDVLIQMVKGIIEKIRSGGIDMNSAKLPEESVYLQEYNMALVRKLEDKLTQLEDAHRVLAVKDFAIASSISGIVLMDLPGTAMTYVNPAFAKMWGYKEDELIGKHPAILARDADAVSKIMRRLMDEGSWIGELEAKTKDNSLFFIQLASHKVMSPQGVPLCLMASCMDITEQKRSREEFQRAEKLESLSLFAAGLAHDFNNLLTGLFNSIELAKELAPPESLSQESFKIALSVFQRAKDLTQRLLTFAKGEPAVRRKFKAAEIIKESCALSLSGSSVRCIFSDADNSWLVEADGNQLSQVFNNIILNARQAMGDNGILNVSVENCNIKAGYSGSLPAGNYVSIRFADNGSGIPPDLLPRIFNPFFTTKQSGSGLGLTTSYSIIKSHGGHIGVTSIAGRGTTFEIWLPAVIGSEPENISMPASKPAMGSGRILIMDDEECIRNLVQRILIRAGYDASVSANGMEAIASFRAAAASQNPYDLAILDLTICGGTGGEETLAELLKIDPHVAAIASTGYSDGAIFRRLMQCGFLSVLPKPYLSHELLSTVKAAVANKS